MSADALEPMLDVARRALAHAHAPYSRFRVGACVRSGSGELSARLKTILEGLNEIIAEHTPGEVALEKVFVNVNPQSTLLLGQARGAALTALVSRDLEVSEYTALQMKKAIVGHGQARKEQVQEMVKRLLRLPGHPSADAADALACAICHAHGGMGLGAIVTRGRRVRAGRIA